MQKPSLIFRLLGVLLLTGVVVAACAPGARVGGVVKGMIYSDANGNGTIDPGDGPLDGATVSLSLCGPIQTQTTAADGSFNFTNLPEGTCNISVAKAGWTFSGSSPSLGYPLPVASNPDQPTALSILMAPQSGIGAATASSASALPTATLPPVPTDTPEPTATSTNAPVVEPTSTSSAPVVPSGSAPSLTAANEAVNCRFGPSAAYLAVGFLKIGQSAAILGTNRTRDWWQIQNPQDVTGQYCWVAGTVVNTSGDIGSVTVVDLPVAQVTNVTVTPALGAVPTVCGAPAADAFNGSVTVNGPVTLTFHWDIYDQSGRLLIRTSDQFLKFTAAGTQGTNYPGSYSADCGSYVTKLVIISPVKASGETNWQVVP